MYRCACGRTYESLPTDEFTFDGEVLRHAKPRDGEAHDYVETGEPAKVSTSQPGDRLIPGADGGDDDGPASGQ